MNDVDEDIKEEFVTHFCKHLVPIEITYNVGGENQVKVYTSFLLSVQNQWFLLTAGHCINSIDEVTAAGYQIVQCRLIDTLASDAIDNNPQPFIFKREEIKLFYEKGEYDYAVIALSPYYSGLLLKNGVKPLDEEVWKKQPSTPINRHIMLGIPEQLTKYDSKEAYISPTIIFIEKLEKRPPEINETKIPHFYGLVLSPNPYFDIHGMSGGPIFACQYVDGRLHYWIVALAMSWLKHQYIVGCWITEFGNFLESILLIPK